MSIIKYLSSTRGRDAKAIRIAFKDVYGPRDIGILKGTFN